ncbi:acetyltransferase [Phlyctema vagabunda]|uniref:Acetyltransferase n=1 Tax=Phlyctema vagabunda TaxID=108571 RepID=A0ABR4P970_9HELO
MAGFLNTYITSPTHHIILRNPEPQDAAGLSKILSEPSNIESDPHMSASGIDEATCETVIARMRESASAAVPTRVNLVIALIEPAEHDESRETLIGLSGFGGIDEIDGKRFADVGAVLLPEYRRRGYALEAMRLSIEFAFRELKTEAVSAQVLDRNERMRPLLQNRLGWEGVRSEGKHGAEWRFEMDEAAWKEMKTRLAWP